jgi:hypothetical protein
MLRAPFASALVLLGTSVAFPQQPAPKDATPNCTFSEVYKKDGWTVPGVHGAKVKQRATLTDLPGVFVTILEPADAQTNIPEIWCPQDHPGRLVLDDSPIRIMVLWSFDCGGRVFAYRISYAEEAIYNGERHELAAATSVFFYDMEGSGKFTVLDAGKRLNGKGWGYLPSFIPDWAKNNAAAPPAK